ncbi:leucine-rich repeat protein 1 [Cloeon dipterum]|uniref:leucine-rich repeat protein 1 n=1 Tax=Cloeon dipterum TaxID=197152 RepID=UPI00321F91B2
MKIICDLCINNLDYAGLMVVRNRARRCQISVINGDVSQRLFLIVQSADNKTGTRYDLTGNIDRMFERFVSEGKCTIRLKSPHVDLIFSNCDALRLGLFLKTVKTGVVVSNNTTAGNESLSCGKSTKRPCADLPATQKKFKVPKVPNLYDKSRTSLIIHSRRELVTSTFSQTLVELKLAGLALGDFPPSVSKLARLKILDLSNNEIRRLPNTFVAKLVELNLSGNALASPYYKNWRLLALPNVKSSLQVLDLSDNNLAILPLDIVKLEMLTSLNLSNNHITRIPTAFGLLKRLRNLDISRNMIVAIDVSFKMLKLNTCDISDALTPPPLNTMDNFPSIIPSSVPSLRSIASAYVIERGLNYEVLPMTVQDDMLLMRRCLCLKVVAHSAEEFSRIDVRHIAQTCIFSNGDSVARMNYSICNNCRKRKFVHIMPLFSGN